MNKKLKIALLATPTLALALTLPIIATSCSTHTHTPELFNDQLNNDKYIDLYKYATEGNYNIHEVSKKLGHSYSQPWYDSLGDAGNWNYKNPGDKLPENLYCSTKKQALALYLCNAGEFWNVDLHKNTTPTDKPNYLIGQKLGGYIFGGEHLDIRGADYQLISESLKDASIPANTVVYHGVEFMEDEFYNQLQALIQKNGDDYDYSKCVGQTITSYGFISTTFDKSMSEAFCDGYNWIDGSNHLPLKEKFIFKIYIPGNVKGAAYVSYFDFMGSQNTDDQILIDRNSEYKILKTYKNGDINYFDLLYLGINKNI